jgi:hypothetical protein
MGNFKDHPVLKDLQAKYFRYTSGMYPFQFKEYFHWLPVHIPGKPPAFVHITRYQAGLTTAANQERARWRKHVRNFYGASIAPPLKSWLGSAREGAVFGGHGLPEEISLVCSTALATGYVEAGNLVNWAYKWIGLDCNGFSSAYLASLGTFSRPVHKHAQYAVITRVATSPAELTYDSVLLWVKSKATGDGHEIIENPGPGAHIAVLDCWHQHPTSIWVTERGGASRFSGHVGLHTGIYDIVEKPKSGAAKENAVWKVRARDAKRGIEKVFITREMQTY